MQKRELSAIIIDDAYFSRDLIRQSLEEKGITIVGEASSGMEGLSLYKKHKPDIVTLEAKTHNNNGLDIIKSLLSFDKLANILVITSLYDVEEEALSLGAKAFLRKPFQPAFLWRRIDYMSSSGCFEDKVSQEKCSGGRKEIVGSFIEDDKVYEESFSLNGSSFVKIETHVPNEVILEIEDVVEDIEKVDEVEDNKEVSKTKEAIEESILHTEIKAPISKNKKVEDETVLEDTKEPVVDKEVKDIGDIESFNNQLSDGIISIRPPRNYNKGENINIHKQVNSANDMIIVSSNDEPKKKFVEKNEGILSKLKKKFKI